MSHSYRPLARSLAAGALAAAIAFTPTASAEVPVPTDNAFAIPGASADAWAPALLDRLDPWSTDGRLAPLINAHYYDCGGCTPVVVRYPRTAGPLFGPGAPFADESIAIGAGIAIDEVIAAEGPSVISGLSLGSITADAAQQALDGDPHRPDPSRLTFIVAGDPSRVTPLSTAIGSFAPAGWRIPLLGWTATRPSSDSVYDTVVVVGEYDIFADFPDRPWNLLALLNAVAGTAYMHSHSALSSPTDVPPANITTTTNGAGATTTTYLVPSPVLPMIRPFELILPDRFITAANNVLKPIVDRGYSRYDAQTGNRMPYLEPTDRFPKLVRSSLAVQRPQISRAAAASRTPAHTPPNRQAAAR